MFPIIVFIIFAAQIIIIEFGGKAFRLYKYGLHINQWLICIGFGLISIVWSFCLKFISEDKCAQIGKNEVNPLTNNSRVMSLKGSRNPENMSRRYSTFNLGHTVHVNNGEGNNGNGS